jgi:hypothetical protein
MAIKGKNLLMKKREPTIIGYTTSGKPLDELELADMIRVAEAGKFHSIETVKVELEKWKIKYKKQRHR